MKLLSARDNRETFKNLYSLYVYDLSEGTPFLGKLIQEDGLYSPPRGIDPLIEDTEAYVIVNDEGKPVGFVDFVENGEADYCIQAIFVLRAYRRQGIAKEIVDNYIKNHHGTFLVHILKGSSEAIDFFKNRFLENGIACRQEERDAIAWNFFAEI